MRLRRKFGTCSRCLLFATAALGVSVAMLFTSLQGPDPVSRSLALSLLAVSATFVTLHILGWARRHESSRPE